MEEVEVAEVVNVHKHLPSNQTRLKTYKAAHCISIYLSFCTLYLFVLNRVARIRAQSARVPTTQRCRLSSVISRSVEPSIQGQDLT